MLLEINGTLILAAISFVLFAIVMNFIFYKPIQDVIYKRQTFLDEGKALAESNFSTTSKLAENMANDLVEARKGAREELAQKTTELKAQKSEQLKDAAGLGHQELEQLRSQIADEATEASKELDKSMLEYKTILCSKFFDDSVLASTLGKDGGDNA